MQSKDVLPEPRSTMAWIYLIKLHSDPEQIRRHVDRRCPRSISICNLSSFPWTTEFPHHRFRRSYYLKLNRPREGKMNFIQGCSPLIAELTLSSLNHPSLRSLNTWKREESFFSSYFLSHRFPLKQFQTLASLFNLDQSFQAFRVSKPDSILFKDGRWKNKSKNIVSLFFP